MKKSERITFVIPSLVGGGAERVVSNLANNLSKRGLEISIIMVSNAQSAYPLQEQIHVENLNCEQDNHLPFLKRYRLRLKKIREAVIRIAPSVVISFLTETNRDVCFALKGLNVPIIVSERNDPSVSPAGVCRKILRSIAYRKPVGFVFQTPEAQNYFSKRIRNKSKIILNPISDKLPNPISDKEKRVVAVGRLHKQKNFPLLLDAFEVFSKKHTEYVLEIYGEGVLEEQINQIIKEKGLQEKVILKGFCKNVHQKIASAGMFVMTSDFEGMPNALIEAMALGLPCISTDCPCGGPRMLIQNKINGLLVPIKDTSALIDAMDYIAENPLSAKEMAQNAVKVREITNIEKVVNDWEEMINDCLGVK